ncbi:MAG: hypothetical protein NTX25_13295 [Proteobacteria bacterium]|nr:hypothetical protein [Pseudomonadota bacterium]
MQMGLWIRLIVALVFIAKSNPCLAQASVKYIRENEDLGLRELGVLPLDYEISTAELESWSKFYPFVSSLISDKIARELSKVQPALMKDYHWLPGPLPELRVWGASEQWLVYEAVLSQLPAMSAVERELRVFIVSLKNSEHQFLPNTVIVTITGRRRE